MARKRCEVKVTQNLVTVCPRKIIKTINKINISRIKYFNLDL